MNTVDDKWLIVRYLGAVGDEESLGYDGGRCEPLLSDQVLWSVSPVPISYRTVLASSERIGPNCCCPEPISYLALESAFAVATAENLASGAKGLFFLMLRS